MEVKFDGHSVDPFYWGNVDSLKYPCQDYHNKTEDSSGTIQCDSEENMNVLKRIIEMEKKRQMSHDPAEVIQELLDKAELLTAKGEELNTTFENDFSDLFDMNKDIKNEVLNFSVISLILRKHLI